MNNDNREQAQGRVSRRLGAGSEAWQKCMDVQSNSSESESASGELENLRISELENLTIREFENLRIREFDDLRI